MLCTNRLNGHNRLIEASEKSKWLSDIKEPELWEILYLSSNWLDEIVLLKIYEIKEVSF